MRRFEPVYRAVVGLLLFVFGPVLRLDVRGHGTENVPAEGGAVLAITHFGYLEFAFTGKVIWHRSRRLVRFMATKASFDHWASGPLMRAMRHVPVDRNAGGGAYAEAVRRLRDGELVGVFPESQVNRAWVVGPCKTGAIRMAAEAGVPLIPVAVWGGHRVITRGRKPTFRQRRGIAVRVEFGAPIPVAAGDSFVRAEHLQERLQALVDTAVKAYPQTAEPGAWWMPAALGGSAPSVEEATAMDAADAAERLRRKASRAA